jgi:cell division protease FtsH
MNIGILKVHALRLKFKSNISLNELARDTSGLAGIHLEDLLNKTAILCGRNSRKEVDHREINETYERVFDGRERRTSWTLKI